MTITLTALNVLDFEGNYTNNSRTVKISLNRLRIFHCICIFFGAFLRIYSAWNLLSGWRTVGDILFENTPGKYYGSFLMA